MARILVVEDSAAMRAYVRAALEGSEADGQTATESMEVVEASSGFDALRLLPRGRFDVVVTDINMPDINGLELIRFVRESEHHRDIAVMIISSQTSPKDRERGLALGADGYLAKPFPPERLRRAVAESMAKREVATGSARDRETPPASERE